MPYVRNLAVLALGLLAMSAHAGLLYRYTSKSTKALAHDSSARVWIDGEKKRVQLDPDPSNPRSWDVAITKQGKTTYINLQNKTYFHAEAGNPGGAPRRTSGSFALPTMTGGQLKGKPKVTYENAGAGPVQAGQPTTKHVIQVRYRLLGEIGGTPLQGEVDVAISVLTATALPFSEVPPVRTGFAEIDDELARLFATFEGMALRQEVSINRRLEDSPIFNELSTISIEELKVIDVDASVFSIPPGLTYQEPAYGVPG